MTITKDKVITHFGQFVGGCPICSYDVHWYDGCHYPNGSMGSYYTYLRCEEGHQFEGEAMQEILQTCGFQRTDNKAQEGVH